MSALLKSFAGSSYVKLIGFIVVGLYAYWQDNRANAAIKQNVQYQRDIALIEQANLSNVATIEELQQIISQHEKLMLAREKTLQAVKVHNQKQKIALNATIKESSDETTIAWADHNVPDVVIGLLNNSASSSTNQNNKTISAEHIAYHF